MSIIIHARRPLIVFLMCIALFACAPQATDVAVQATSAPPSATSQPAPPTAAPTEAPLGQPFTSQRFGYTLLYPQGWLVKDKPGEWAEFDPLDPNRSGGIDAFAAYIDSRNLSLGIGARALPDGSDLEAWSETAKQLIVNGVSRGVCYEGVENEPAPAEAITLDGEPAVLLAYHCPETYDHFGLVVLSVREGQGYWITWLSPQGSDDEDRAALMQILSTFEFVE